MKLSRKCEYACLVLIDLARGYDAQTPLSSAWLAEKNSIPRKFLDQILNQLKKQGYVASLRGSAGGYILGKPPNQISLAEIIRTIDGPIAPINSVSDFFYQHTPSEQNEKLLACFRDIRDYAAQKLEQLTFEQLV